MIYKDDTMMLRLKLNQSQSNYKSYKQSNPWKRLLKTPEHRQSISLKLLLMSQCRSETLISQTWTSVKLFPQRTPHSSQILKEISTSLKNLTYIPFKNPSIMTMRIQFSSAKRVSSSLSRNHVRLITKLSCSQDCKNIKILLESQNL